MIAFTTNGVSESKFNMWRAVFAMAHADGIVTGEEEELLREFLSNTGFSDEQKNVLERDIMIPQQAGDFFHEITEQSDRDRFFYYARLISWCDGDFGKQEKQILDNLKISAEEISKNNELTESLKKSAELAKTDSTKTGDEKSFWKKLFGTS